MKPKRCRALVWPQSLGGWHSKQCSRKVWKDGFCKQHHPDTVRERNRKRVAECQGRWDNSPQVLLLKSEQENQRLRRALKKVEKELTQPAKTRSSLYDLLYFVGRLECAKPILATIRRALKKKC
tara:strand:- start:65606 stop:65977 length:372 start_codon:yes stop_codon:yes gene_type:complete